MLVAGRLLVVLRIAVVGKVYQRVRHVKREDALDVRSGTSRVVRLAEPVHVVAQPLLEI